MSLEDGNTEACVDGEMRAAGFWLWSGQQGKEIAVDPVQSSCVAIGDLPRDVYVNLTPRQVSGVSVYSSFTFPYEAGRLRLGWLAASGEPAAAWLHPHTRVTQNAASTPLF